MNIITHADLLALNIDLTEMDPLLIIYVQHDFGIINVGIDQCQWLLEMEKNLLKKYLNWIIESTNLLNQYPLIHFLHKTSGETKYYLRIVNLNPIASKVADLYIRCNPIDLNPIRARYCMNRIISSLINVSTVLNCFMYVYLNYNNSPTIQNIKQHSFMAYANTFMEFTFYNMIGGMVIKIYPHYSGILFNIIFAWMNYDSHNNYNGLNFLK